MTKIAHTLLNMDRRIIFLIVIGSLILPLIPKFETLFPPPKETQIVRGVFDQIEGMPSGSVVWLSFDFDPASQPELRPMAVALIRHAFRKKHRVIAMNLWDTGIVISEDILAQVAAEFEKKGQKKEYGKDYVFLGWQPGTVAVITSLGINIFNTFPKDYYGKVTRDMEVFKGLTSLKDLATKGYFICISAGSPGIDTWVVYGADRYKFKMGGGCTAVIEPGLRPFYDSKQITGLIVAMKGAAEYEKFLEEIDQANKGMVGITCTQILIGILVIMSAILYALVGRKK